MFLAQGAVAEVPSVAYFPLSPLLVILAAACLGVLVEAFLPRHQRWASQVTLTLLALVVAGVLLGAYAVGGAKPVVTLAGSISVDRPTLFLWGTLLALGLGGVLLIADRSVEPGGSFITDAAGVETARVPAAVGAGGNGPGSGETRREVIPPGTPQDRITAGRAGMQTEVLPLTLFALAGMMTFCAANDLLTMFVALEVLSLPLYLLCGLARRRRLLSQEAAVKYFLLGAFASAFFLYGLALLYGYAGSVKLADIAAASAGSQRSDTLLFGGLALLVVGLLFKASVGPFHTWTPDVYQGAPTPVTAFMSAATKVAAFGAILRVLTVGFGVTRWEWRGVLWAVAIASMVIGAVIGLTQTDIKRLVAYSSVAHAGFILVGAIAITESGLSGTLFYLLTYGFTSLAVFAVISLVRDGNGEATHLSQWAGLAKRSPVTAAIMSFLLLALAGIPLTSGFTGKFAVFSAALADGMAPLVIIALVASAVAAFFYLRVIVLMYFSEPAPDGPTVTVPGAFTTAAITLGVLITLLLGVVPTLALTWAGAGGFVS
ncbi:NADH-quinone oxidoreductase subunit NuoN [Pseudonocardia acaciae]|uniref:NADH-quinone oxidoreductase subunit NuoN n=1 Tax=Pseudonocardia acaciae TaxID=551276 RepID=UPI00056C2A4C|nr:NADH-quinone oxidoreductase subunit NuoN [Pseudonocardia acaciae]